MANKWQVAFVDAGNCEIEIVPVECHWIYNAAKLAMKKLADDQQAVIDAECVTINITKLE